MHKFIPVVFVAGLLLVATVVYRRSTEVPGARTSGPAILRAASLIDPVIKHSSSNELPAGTQVEIRLKTKVASDTSKPKDKVEAVVIAPVRVKDRIVIPAGTLVHGSVKDTHPVTKPDERAALELIFDDLSNGAPKPVRISARLAGVDNAREKVEESGRIVGILASETLSAQVDQGLGKISKQHSVLNDILEAAKGAFMKAPEVEIVYPAGVEMTLKLTKSLPISALPSSSAATDAAVASPDSELSGFVRRQPFRTMTEKPSKPSDITNLMFLASEDDLETTFTAAGWSTAAALNAKSGLETFRAIVENRGYKEAPMSTLLLDGEKPELVFQKQNNTFAQRHHLRVWRRPETFQGRTVWVSSSTHDTGIEFSPENRTFIHKIDSKIDRERSKVVNDLMFTGHAKLVGLVDRPEVPRDATNATGDNLDTDGRMAVLVLH